MTRNRWFQSVTLRSLERLVPDDEQITLFAYSYAAEKLFEFARARGWRTVLGQIDPGPFEEAVVDEESRRHPQFSASWERVPAAYWEGWRREVALADTVIVNSPWSAEGLRAEGLSEDRMKIVPLPYDPPLHAQAFRRVYPPRFDDERPLRALFLGQVNLRKGMRPLLEAAHLLKGAPVEFHVVGPDQLLLPPEATRGLNVIWHGPVSKGAVERFYRAADIMLLPTLSDGFGLTQLEARAWRLPVLVTPRCGAVIEDDVTGIVMQPGDAHAIVAAIERCIRSPAWLQSASEAIAPGERWGLDDIAATLSQLQ